MLVLLLKLLQSMQQMLSLALMLLQLALKLLRFAAAFTVIAAGASTIELLKQKQICHRLEGADLVALQLQRHQIFQGG